MVDCREIERIAEIDFGFHHLIAMATGNFIYPLLLNSFRQVYTSFTKRFFSDPEVVSFVFGFHGELMQAIEDKDEKRATEIDEKIAGTRQRRLEGHDGRRRKGAAMSVSTAEQLPYSIKEPGRLSPRIEWLRDYYFKGCAREWNNEFTAWTTGTPWDVQYDEAVYYIVPETFAFLQTFRSSFHQAARPVRLHAGLLEMEPAGTEGLVHQGGHGELRAPGDPSGRSHRRGAVQRPDLDVSDQEGIQGEGPPDLRQEGRQGEDEIVPRPRLRECGGHERSSHSGIRAGPRDRLEGDPRGSRFPLRALERAGEEGRERGPAEGHDDGGDHAP